MYATSPPESVHALDLSGLRHPAITFWSVWIDDELVGCGALKELKNSTGEIKSMRTAREHLRKGVARKMLSHIIEAAKHRGMQQLFLETGSMDFFKPAHKLYTNAGFISCGPFDKYVEDPNSIFMTLVL